MTQTTGTLEYEDIRLVPEVATGAAGPAVDAALPGSERLTWGPEPVEAPTAKRGEICLNGLWQFCPMLEPGRNCACRRAGLHPRARLMAARRVGHPPAWPPSRPQGPAWSRYGDGGRTWCAWYIRKIKVPQAWAGRAVLLSLQRVSTDAIVYVNGKQCGAVAWPSGQADITSAVTPGGEDTLWIEVMSSRHGPASGFLEPGPTVGRP